jgi:hypothetical protein
MPYTAQSDDGHAARRLLQGALLDGIVAPDITKAGLTQMGFDPLVLSAFMKSGISDQGAMANQMFEVVHFSTQYMSHGDLNALSAYLFENSSSSRQDAPVRYRLIRAARRSDLPRERFRPMALKTPSARQPEGPFTLMSHVKLKSRHSPPSPRVR